MEAVAPTIGLNVLHLFCKAGAGVDRKAFVDAIESCTAGGDGAQVVTATILGHKADLAVMALGPDLRALRELQSGLDAAGAFVTWSYVSLTEVSEYAAGIPEEMRQARLYPKLPPDGMPAFCFYPMTKRREPGSNWYQLPYEERLRLMHGHGAVGREFRGRVLQLITGSTGLDDWEWGVTLFGVHPDDLKDCVYRMRFDEASASYAEFGPFLTGVVGTPEEVLSACGVR
ncbi:MAG TPA: chlorite dismutase family protein [Acidimicrobiales bacterium]|nr:chlorite dismutase family protein [Acidimicrobiales bacterium]